jgi:oxalate decarboxylase/phosphoglucose isomerase-like protein (cupin superfamily)
MMDITDDTGFDLTGTYLFLSASGDTDAVPVDDNFWDRIRSREAHCGDRLMGALRITEDPSHWEVHPDGEEILFLRSGSMDVILQEDGKERVVKLRDSGVCIIPRGVWHKQIVHSSCEFAFITPIKNTQTRTV